MKLEGRVTLDHEEIRAAIAAYASTVQGLEIGVESVRVYPDLNLPEIPPKIAAQIDLPVLVDRGIRGRDKDHGNTTRKPLTEPTAPAGPGFEQRG
jgi:hypothetical protein